MLKIVTSFGNLQRQQQTSREDECWTEWCQEQPSASAGRDADRRALTWEPLPWLLVAAALQDSSSLRYFRDSDSHLLNESLSRSLALGMMLGIVSLGDRGSRPLAPARSQTALWWASPSPTPPCPHHRLLINHFT